MAPSRPVNVSEIKLEDIDFEKVKETSDKRVLKKYIQLLEEDGGYFSDLLKATKEKLLQVAPKEYYLLYPRIATHEEVDAATQDLLDWEESVKETDTALRNAKKEKIWDEPMFSKVAAPIRGQEAAVARPNITAATAGKNAEKRELKNEKEKFARDKTRMKDYYDAWEQMDVDRIEEEMDKEEREAEEARRRHFEEMEEEQAAAHKVTPVAVGDCNVPKAHRKHMADSEKEKGNEAFYARDYDEAEAYYSRSLHYLADDPSTWANRALVRLKLDRPGDALEDCEHALALNPKYMKALHRKGKALFDLHRFEEAVQNFRLALAESPGNTQINGDLMMARRKLRAEGSQPATRAPPSSRTGMVSRPVDAEPTCIVEEIEDDEEEDQGANQASSAQAVRSQGPPAPAPGYTRVLIEEDSDSEEEVPVKVPTASTGFTKVLIEEDSGSDAEPPQQPASVPAASPAGASRAGFTKVLIEEDSGSDAEPPQQPASVPAAPPAGASRAGFTKVMIEEASDSDEDPPAPVPKATVPTLTPARKEEQFSFSPPSRAPVESSLQHVDFDDMD